MTTDMVFKWINGLWIVLVGIWLVVWMVSKKTKRIETAGSAALHIGVVLAGLLLVFWPGAAFGGLGGRAFPDRTWIAELGLGMTAAGVLLSVWSRLALGSNWSALAVVKDDHELIRKGPYAWVRHPMYSGFLLGLAGTAIAYGEVRDLVGVAVVTLGLRIKIAGEERLLIDQFGDIYRDYRNTVRALIPFIL